MIPSFLFAQGEPRVITDIRDELSYERPPPLEEEDLKRGEIFRFQTGLEIVSNVEALKVSIFDLEVGRTPYENNGLANGQIRIKLEKPGYSDFSFWARQQEDHRTTVQVYYDSLPPGEDKPYEIKPSRALYSHINPYDPLYYRSLLFETFEDYSEGDIGIYLGVTGVAKPRERENLQGYSYSWDGSEEGGGALKVGEYQLKTGGDKVYPFTLDTHFTRRAASYFSGISGLALVPSARPLFQGDIHIATTFNWEGQNLPLFLFLRLSPLPGWEVAVEGKAAFAGPSEESHLGFNSSQKFLFFRGETLYIAAALRGSLGGGTKALPGPRREILFADPEGISLFLPIEWAWGGWILLLSPEFLYLSSPDYQVYKGALRGGAGYTGDWGFAAFSTAFISPRDIYQLALEGGLYLPGSPLYVKGQYTRQWGAYGRKSALGLTLGFLL